MKTLAKIVILLVCAFASTQIYAQCTPDTNMPIGSILPENIKVAYKDVAYSEVIFFSAPKDTSTIVGSARVPVRVDSIEIVDVKGLPTGFTYNCLNGICKVNGGEYSCLTLTGTPTQNGVYPLVVNVNTYATLTGFVDIPLPVQIDSVTRFTLYVYGSVGYLENSLENTLKVFPNPANDRLNINTTSTQKVTAQLFDISGKLQTEQCFTDNATIDLKAFAKGIYILKLNSDTQQITRKIIVE